MVIGIDGRVPLARGRGWGRYTRELLSALAVTRDIELRTVLPSHVAGASWVSDLAAHRSVRLAFAAFDETAPDRYNTGARGTSIEDHFDDLDLVHSPTRFVLPTTVRPIVVTIHDIAPLSDPPFKPEYRDATIAALDFIRRECAHVITVSAFTRDELVRIGGFEAASITVVHHGISNIFRAAASRIRDNYILYVGGAGANKNLDRAIAAVRDLRRTTACELVLAGEISRDAEQLRSAIGPIIPSWLHVRGYVSDAELANLYHRARVCIMPSLHEGFGLPVSEAMACGTPLACSALPVFEEIAGDAALYFDPTNVAAIVCVLQTLIEDDRLRSDLAAKGLVRARQFTWMETATKTAGVYRRAIADA